MTAKPQGLAPAVLHIRRRFAASPERIFKAWTDPQALLRWFAPPGARILDAECDLRVDGAYRISMQVGEGAPFDHHGRYLEIDPPRRLVFSWLLEYHGCARPAGEMCESVVEIDLRPHGEETELLLTHTLLPSETSCAAHERGWTGCLDGLETYLKTARVS